MNSVNEIFFQTVKKIEEVTDRDFETIAFVISFAVLAIFAKHQLLIGAGLGYLMASYRGQSPQKGEKIITKTMTTFALIGGVASFLMPGGKIFSLLGSIPIGNQAYKLVKLYTQTT